MRAAARLLAMLFLLGACSATPPEEALRASVAGLEAALEARDADAMANVLADDFAGPDGMDVAAARRLARLSFLRHRDVGVAIGPLDIAMLDGHATVRFTAVLTGGAGWLPERGSIYHVETGWRRDGGDWRLTSARWERDL
ncbi:MAG TPA: nuclear transport factor 2 family protein [Xanthomonadaceae bacterium]|nr:nuclear transport factor 2 family protein [Xanthomonadaceae bacterium]